MLRALTHSIPQFRNKPAAMHADGAAARNAFQENALCAIIEEAHASVQEALCERLERGESTPNTGFLKF